MDMYSIAELRGVTLMVELRNLYSLAVNSVRSYFELDAVSASLRYCFYPGNRFTLEPVSSIHLKKCSLRLF